MSIEVKQLTKYFKSFKREAGLKGALRSFFNREYENFYALKDVDLHVDKGEILGILGENGAGKTTLIKLMVGLLHPSSGMVDINGFTPWERKNDFLKIISIVMGQKNQLWWDIPASESFLLNQRIYEIDEKQFHKMRDELVELLDVKEKLNVQVRRLSLGERMKMEIIASLLHNPSIVLFDEPTIGLDVISQSKIREFVKYYNEQYKTTFLLTSHYMNDIEAMCKRVFVIHKGSGLYDGNFETLINKVKPPRKLMFEFSNNIDLSELNSLKNTFEFYIQDRILTAESTDETLNSLMASLFKLDTPISFSIEDLPVEDSMKSFFEDPEHYLK